MPWAALASCWPLPQQLLPVSAAGGGRRCCALGIIRGKIILYFGITERLRAFRYPIFTGGVVEGDGICSAAFCSAEATPSGSLRSPAPPRGRLCAMPETFPPPPKAVPLGKVASPQAMTEGVLQQAEPSQALPRQLSRRESFCADRQISKAPPSGELARRKP